MRNINASSPHSSAPSPSVVLIGSRGCGKRTLGFIGALHSGRKLVTADRFFEAVTGQSRIEYLRKHGEGALLQLTVTLVLRMLRENEMDCIIECGMSSLNTEVQNFLAGYKKSHPVIYIMRNFDEIKTLLNLGDVDARRLKMIDSKHRNYSNLEYYNLSDSASTSENTASGNGTSPHHLKQAKLDFCHFLDRIICSKLHNSFSSPSPFDISSSAVEKRLYTYALAVKISELADRSFDPVILESGYDAIRLIVDVKEQYSFEAITNHIAWIRRNAQIPIVYEVVGFDPAVSTVLSLGDSEHLQLLSHGIRNCVEYTIVSLDLPDHLLHEVISQKRRTKVIGSSHDQAPGRCGWQSQSRYVKCQKAQSLGCDLVQLTQVATTRNDNEEMQAFIGSLASNHCAELPIIAYNTGSLGRNSLVFNKILTPIRPPSSSALINEGDITAQQAMRGLFSTFVFDSLKFYHFGASVSWSPFPPAMHKAAYQELGLQHSYQVFETSALQTLHELARSPDFGGASISLPFKSSILSSIDIQSPHATAIGAINTLLPLRESLETNSISLEYQASQRNRAGPVVGLYGDNTDWLGIFECVHRNLSPRNTIRSSKTTGLVIGAGGAAREAIYALIQMRCRKILMFNRTVRHAEQVAAHFNSWVSKPDNSPVVGVIRSMNDSWPVDLQPATIIISCIPAHGIDGQPPANLILPENWLQSKSGGVVADLAYRPLETPLLKQIRDLKSQSAIPWVTVDGLEMLAIQAIHQFELMTGRKAPRAVMKSQVHGLSTRT
ncbi:unnamed protein product [Penicillium salamii]|nr:unnamed protein product [Penicillium salamii]CAG8296724.1 unnamed protein product [Penicillium salamii]